MTFIKKILGMTDKPSDIIKETKETAGIFLNKEQGSTRHSVDMLSDSWLSKAIRPLVVIWCLVILTVFMVMDSRGIKISEQWIVIVKVISISSIGFYFPSRLIEKYIKGKDLFNSKK